jgi:hypothetical protein
MDEEWMMDEKGSKHVTRSQKGLRILNIINQNQTFFSYHLKP